MEMNFDQRLAQMIMNKYLKPGKYTRQSTETFVPSDGSPSTHGVKGNLLGYINGFDSDILVSIRQ